MDSKVGKIAKYIWWLGWIVIAASFVGGAGIVFFDAFKSVGWKTFFSIIGILVLFLVWLICGMIRDSDSDYE